MPVSHVKPHLRLHYSHHPNHPHSEHWWCVEWLIGTLPPKYRGYRSQTYQCSTSNGAVWSAGRIWWGIK